MPPSGGVAFQNHYTPYGKETVEKTQMGLYFYPKGQEPKYVLRTFGIFDFSIVIPPGAEWHQEQAYIDVPKEMVLYGLTPPRATTTAEQADDAQEAAERAGARGWR